MVKNSEEPLESDNYDIVVVFDLPVNWIKRGNIVFISPEYIETLLDSEPVGKGD